MSTNGITRIESGVDWMTCTGNSHRAWEKVQGMASSLWEEETRRGHKHFHQSRHGFSMSCAGGVQYGTGNGGWMVVLQSELARKFWMSFAAYSNHISRIDLQATVWYNSDQAGVIEGLYRDKQEATRKKGETNVTIILNGNRGDTVYVGSRASSQFGRIYDKYRQQKFAPYYENSLRWEVEYKKPLSGEVVMWMLNEHPNDDELASKVFSWFSLRGINPPVLPRIGDTAIQALAKVTPIDKKIEWLRKTVRPVYRQLKLLDMQTEADEAIGILDDIETIRERES